MSEEHHSGGGGDADTRRRRSTIVSFSKDKDEISISGNQEEEEDDDDEDCVDFQLAFAPYIQTYLAHTGESIKCCGIVNLPVPFERASKRSWWWDLRFDSEILERQYRKSSFSQIRLRFRFALGFLIILATLWSMYLFTMSSLDQSLSDFTLPLGLIYLSFAIGCSFVFLLTSLRTQTRLYRRYTIPLSIIVSLALCSLSLITVFLSSNEPSVVSSASNFAMCVAILLVVYTVVPLPLCVCVLICCMYSVAFEVLGDSYWSAKKFLHMSVHLIGLHIFIMTNVRMRGTFMKVGQSLLVRKQLEMEKQLKEKMINSVMPKDVAVWLLEEEKRLKEAENRLRTGEIDPLFRPFQMDCMKDVSILFADIVGFTRMSSKKTASELVAILNELFGRFDELCVHNYCEKISTLGDCYYCVSGCPTPRSDHAQCCVEMGLGMIKAIAEFDHENHEDINMRVGVHTGSVLCGIVGRRRFKFDVWSNDVTFANKMESSGRPGRVHISASTRHFLGDSYILEKGDEYHGVDTFFIVSRRENFGEDTTQATITSLTSDAKTEPILTISSTMPSYETAVTHANTLEAAAHVQSIECNTWSSSHANSTSPFGTITTDSKPLSDRSTPLSSVAVPQHHLLEVSVDSLTSGDGKATSLPNMSMTNAGDDGRSVMGSGPLLTTTRKPPPSWKYSRLKLNCSDIENGKVQKTYKVSSSGEPSPIEKATNNQLEVPKDDLSYSHSVNSRKDSGIRSNSRRSSIQQQLFALSGLQNDFMNHRVSGYYTSSQSSLNGSYKGKLKSRYQSHLTDSLSACFQKIRKQSDLQLIRCVEDNSKSETNYFEPPPLKPWSLLFQYPEMEAEYREKAHREVSNGPNCSRTLATARFNTYFDITISFIVFSSISLSLLFMYESSVSWLTVFLILLGIQLTVIATCFYSMVRPVLSKIMLPCLKWYPWHIIGGILVSLPLLAALSHVENACISSQTLLVYSCSVFVGIVHFCNFTQLNCWMKSSLATLGGMIYLLMTTSVAIANPRFWAVGNATFDEATFNLMKTNFGFSYAMKFLYDFRPSEIDYSSKPSIFHPGEEDSLHPNFALSDAQIETLRRSYFFVTEISLSISLLVLLVWILNREFEISYRVSFHGNAVAAKDKAKVEEMKVQAEKLLYNIIPRHVAEHLKSTTRFQYSEDIKSVGIIFATVVNFGEIYDESFMFGKECLRFLNELVSDFDDLLDREQFSMVEKIKTIGATFMAASGLDPSSRLKDSHEHLFQLMEFAFALQGAIENFNAHMLSFRFILRVGYNFGDVTAGVIGTNKLHYDIWGDAVNIASRMDTTGVANQIQVPVNCVPVLSQRYDLERRGTVFVKGKDNMDVYLVKDRLAKRNAYKEQVSDKANSLTEAGDLQQTT